MSSGDGTPDLVGDSRADRSHDGASPTDQPAAPERWASGRWSIEVRGDELADVRCDGRVVLRAIRAVARDEDWATAWPTEIGREVGAGRDVDSGAVEAGDDERIRAATGPLVLRLGIRDLGLDLAGTLHVRADGDRLAVDLDLMARSGSSTNRTGLVVLHPPTLAGTALQVTHPDGTSSALEFPAAVSPHQPARDITALAWEADGLSLGLDLTGEVFEMEDQRNWTDASYKTYSRPLDLPFPYTLAAGEHVRQRIVLTAGAVTPADGAAPSAGTTSSTSAEPPATAPVPTATARVQAAGPVAPDADAEELTWHHGGAVPAIGTGHLDLELADPGWPQRLEAAFAEADEGLALWIVPPATPGPSALAALGRRLAAAVEAGAVPRFVGIADAARHVTTPELAGALREVIPEGVTVVAGARSHCTELNREWETVLSTRPDALAFATTPLFHTLETEQLVEAVAIQRLLAEQVTDRVPGLPVHVGPITLRPRFANVATRPQPVPAPAPPVDSRAGTSLHEAWTVASAAALAVPGVASLTYEQVPAPLAELGGRGRAPHDVPAGSVGDSPAAVRAREHTLVTGRSADGLVWAIGDGTTVLLATLSSRTRRVRLPGRPAPLVLDPVSWRTEPAAIRRD